MPLYCIQFSIEAPSRAACIAAFAAMTADDDRKDAGDGVRIVGRWSAVGESAGYCICDAATARALNAWLLNWSTMATMRVTPVVDDNEARCILLKASAPPFRVDYSHAGDEPADGESLYVIAYKFHKESRADGYQHFAQMTEAEDKEDAGANRVLGRWHDLGSGSGIAVCAAVDGRSVQEWASHWTDSCTCQIHPVVTDKEFRSDAATKPQFALPSKSRSSSRWFGN